MNPWSLILLLYMLLWLPMCLYNAVKFLNAKDFKGFGVFCLIGAGSYALSGLALGFRWPISLLEEAAQAFDENASVCLSFLLGCFVGAVLLIMAEERRKERAAKFLREGLQQYPGLYCTVRKGEGTYHCASCLGALLLRPPGDGELTESSRVPPSERGEKE